VPLNFYLFSKNSMTFKTFAVNAYLHKTIYYNKTATTKLLLEKTHVEKFNFFF